MKTSFSFLLIASAGMLVSQPAEAQLKRIVDVSTLLPSNSPTNFSDFDDEVAIVSLDKGKIAFNAKDAAGVNGIYVFDGTNVVKVARGDDVEPAAGGAYGHFLGQRIRDGNVAFVTAERPAATVGVYLWNGSAVTNIASTNTPVPGGAVSEKFLNFSGVDLDGGRLVFGGGGDQSGGLYLWDGSTLQQVVDGGFNPERPWLNGNALTFFGSPGGDRIILRKNLPGGAITHLVDTATPAPGGGTVSSIFDLCATSNHVGFLGQTTSAEGAYLLPEGATDIIQIAKTGDLLPGETGRTFGSFLGMALAESSSGAKGWFLAGDNVGKKILCQFKQDGGGVSLTKLLDERDDPFFGLQLPPTGFDGGLGVFVARPLNESVRALFTVGPNGPLSAPGVRVTVSAQYLDVGPVTNQVTDAFNAQAGLVLADTNAADAISFSEAQGHAFIDVFNQSPVCKALAVAGGLFTPDTATIAPKESHASVVAKAWFRPAGTDPGSNINVNVALSIGGFLDSAYFTRRETGVFGVTTNSYSGEASVSVWAATLQANSGSLLFNGQVALGPSVDPFTGDIELSTGGDWPDPIAHPGNYQIAPSSFGVLPSSITVHSNEVFSAPLAQSWRVAVNRLYTNAISVTFSETFGLELVVTCEAVAKAAYHVDDPRCARSDFFNTVGGAVSTDTPGVHFVLVDESGNPLQPPGTFAAWQAIKFSPAQLADLAVSGQNADPDHDGLPNLLEYAFFREPRTADFTAIPKGSLTNGFLTLTYPRLRAATDLTITPEVAASLGGPWHSGSQFIEETIDDPDSTTPTYTVIARDKTATSEGPMRFGRLRITRN